MNSLIIQSLLLMSLASLFSCSARFGTGLIGRSHHERTDESLDIIKAYQRKYQLNYLPQIDLFDDPLRSGMSVSIFGKLFSDSNGFTIDFITVDADIAFHIGVRFDENKIIRNSNKGGWGRNEWNNEERDGPFPFRRAQRFGLVINLLLNKFQVFFEDEYLFDYIYRFPLHDIVGVSVHGDVEKVKTQLKTN